MNPKEHLAEIRKFSREKQSEIELQTPTLLVFVATAFLVFVAEQGEPLTIFEQSSLFILILFFIVTLAYVVVVRNLYASAFLESHRQMDRYDSTQELIVIGRSLTEEIEKTIDIERKKILKNRIDEIDKNIAKNLEAMQSELESKKHNNQLRKWRFCTNVFYIAMIASLFLAIILVILNLLFCS